MQLQCPYLRGSTIGVFTVYIHTLYGLVPGPSQFSERDFEKDLDMMLFMVYI